MYSFILQFVMFCFMVIFTTSSSISVYMIREVCSCNFYLIGIVRLCINNSLYVAISLIWAGFLIALSKMSNDFLIAGQTVIYVCLLINLNTTILYYILIIVTKSNTILFNHILIKGHSKITGHLCYNFRYNMVDHAYDLQSINALHSSTEFDRFKHRFEQS